MDITPVINTLSQDLARAAHVGGEAVQEAAERLLLALDPALRLALLDRVERVVGVGGQVAGDGRAGAERDRHAIARDVRLGPRDPTGGIQGRGRRLDRVRQDG